MAKKNNAHRGVFTREYQNGSISYGIDYIHPLTGQRVRKILKDASSLGDAVKAREMELTDARRGALDKAYGIREKKKAPTFAGMVEKYLDWSRENKKSWMTDEHRAKPLKAFFENKLLSDLNPFVVEKYKSHRSKTVRKLTVNKEIVFASQVYEKASEWTKYDGPNPWHGKRFKLAKARKPGSLTPDEVAAIMAEVKHSVVRDMVSFAFNTGWRISEIRGLKWEDVDLDKGLAWITDPKNGQAVEIELNDPAREIVSRQTKRGEWVFCKLNGVPYSTNLTVCIKQAAKRAGVALPERKAWHIFRRTWASMMLQAGCDPETLRQLGNWKDYSMPMWYADAGNRDHRRKALNRLPKLECQKSAISTAKSAILRRKTAKMGGSEELSRNS